MTESITSSSLDALTQTYEEVTRNLANATTVGFKRRLNELILAEGEPPPDGGEPPEEIQVLSQTDFSQGPLVHTGRVLDLAVHGKGFFVIETPDGRVYTRNGQFRFNAQGQLVDFLGRTVAGESGPIILPGTVSARDFHVSQDGTAHAGGTSIGKLAVVEFADPSVLEPLSNSNFLAPDDVTPAAAQNSTVHQGFNEAANVSVVEELVNLIRVTRLYEANFRMLAAEDEQMKQILDVAMS